MSTIESVKQTLAELKKNFSIIVLLYIVVDIILLGLIVPFTNGATSFLAKLFEVDYIAYDNILAVISHDLLFIIVMLILLLVILFIVFLQFSILLNGIRQIVHLNQIDLDNLFKDVKNSLHSLNIKTVPFFVFYALVIIPFSDFIFSSPLLSKVKIPQFVMLFIMQNPVIAVTLVALTGLLIYIEVRFILLLPIMSFNWRRPKKMLRNCLQATQQSFWKILFRILIPAGLFIVINFLLMTVWITISYFIEHLLPQYAFLSGQVFLILIQLTQVVTATLSTASVMIVLLQLYEEKEQVVAKNSNYHINDVEIKNQKRIYRFFIGLAIILIAARVTYSNYGYLKNPGFNNVTIISHRGLDKENGVQNTIPALLNVIPEKPDYVEMDIHMTKDRQFVVMHDNNLSALTGKNAHVHDLTLDQLKQLIVSEHNQSAPLASFDDYLQTANINNQKLLIEIKTDKGDNPTEVVNVFNQKYQQNVLIHHHKIHSLSAKVVTELKKINSKFDVNYITTYNIFMPTLNVDGYSMESSTLNRYMVLKAHQNHKNVYAWDINNIEDINLMMLYRVDGLITDNLKEVKESVNELKTSTSITEKLVIYISEINGLKNYLVN
ncbi:glycerophosphodiester phosphodiesterase [Holzapfeliella floricola]|uniref:Glycerophosphoryl diester phosphodiesterase n=1 Tax=Holzapfeliella floricola DSM 23037 = JCM 16512 TaxID=1423744 RepID=A0A0R2DJA0_9LACO|nr:glycerophosphodiester phosphodiesterase [Holzapfeliella floricola]KRN04168.1 glycerophosphoryl diester phosphodiesterase [Holzapfeliella floricola DSM 23037 = JCM 16512]